MYTYAFLKTPSTDLELPSGIMGCLQLINSDQLSAVVEPEFALSALEGDDAQLLQAVLRHDQVIQSLFQQMTLLPLRFGTCFASVEALLIHLQLQQGAYLSRLAQLTDRAEYTLKCLPVELPSSPPLPSAEVRGREYFLAKKRQYQSQVSQQQQQAAELQALQAAIAQQFPQQVSALDDNPPRFHVLVERSRELDLQQQLPLWQQQCPLWQLQLGTPLPPYHFV